MHISFQDAFLKLCDLSKTDCHVFDLITVFVNMIIICWLRFCNNWWSQYPKLTYWGLHKLDFLAGFRFFGLCHSSYLHWKFEIRFSPYQSEVSNDEYARIPVIPCSKWMIQDIIKDIMILFYQFYGCLASKEFDYLHAYYYFVWLFV